MERYGATPSTQQKPFDDDDIEPDDTKQPAFTGGKLPVYSKEIQQT